MYKIYWKTYIIAGVVVGISIAASLYLPLSEFYRGLFSFPGIAGLAGALVQIFRDHSAYQKSLELQKLQQDYSLGVTSHMANVTFDKHVEFCESYIKVMIQGLGKLWASGPSRKAMDIASDLKDVRLKHSTWISTEMEQELISFEQNLINMGVSRHILDDVPDVAERAKLIRESTDIFKVIMGIKESDTEELKGTASTKVKEYLQGVLGIQELFTLRRRAIADAIARLSEK